MAIEKMLLNFLKKGIDTKWFVVSTIGKLDKSCCIKSTIEVIDFDEAEILHRNKCSSISLKSCDALKILPKVERIDFIEMKSSKNLDKNPKLKTLKALKVQIGNFDLLTKVTDSLHVLKAISIHKDISLTAKDRKLLRKTPKQFIFLTDLNHEENGLESFELTLDFLAVTSTDIKDLLKEEIDKIDVDNLNAILKPILMNCSDFETRY